jgi:phage terminase large subunit-like protein
MAAIAAGLDRAKWRPLPHQIPPSGDWDGWLLLGGRFAGKTDAGAKYMVDHANGPPCMPGRHPHRMAIIAPTLDDASYSCFDGPSGIQAHEPDTRKVTQPGGTIVHWPNGSYAKLFGTDTEKATDRLRSGGNNCFVWAEELAAWRWLDLAWSMMEFGLRNGPHPRWVATTTPKPRSLIKRMDRGEMIGVALTRATSHDNPHIIPSVVAKLVRDYGGTALGEQELMGRLVEQDESALWKRDQIARFRLTPEQAPLSIMRRTIVGVDPSGGAGEQGIVVVGFSAEALDHDEFREPMERGYILADMTVTPTSSGGKPNPLQPDQWGNRAIEAAIAWDATEIVFESDYGRDMPASVLNGAAERAGLVIPIRPALARAIGGKRVRAYPVAQKAAQGRYAHVGVFEELEDQQCTWTEDAKYSPDRIDAAVWPAWHTGLVSTTFKGAGSMGGSAMSRRVISGRG